MSDLFAFGAARGATRVLFVGAPPTAASVARSTPRRWGGDPVIWSFLAKFVLAVFAGVLVGEAIVDVAERAGVGPRRK